MKKILTLAVALVMVFALAAPAFAAGWDKPVVTPEFEDLYLNITALSVEESTTVWNGGTFNKLDKTYPVVAGMKVHAYAEIQIPKEGDLSKDIVDRIKAGQGTLKISVDNLESVKMTMNGGTKENWTNWTVKNDGTYKVDKTDFGETIYVEIWGETKASDKDAKITATLGVYNDWKTKKVNGEKREYFDFFSGNDKYTIWKDTAGADYVVTSADDTSSGLRFYTKSSGQVENITAVFNGNVYTIQDYMGGDPSFVLVGDNRPIKGDELRNVKAVLDDICGAMGFEYAGDSYITDELVEDNLGTIVEGSASLVYPSGYFQEIVTNDPGVNPPQTGDSASIAGFVMIAVALVAAAAVTVKKVRA